MEEKEARVEEAGGGKVEFSTVKREDTLASIRDEKGRFIKGLSPNSRGRPRTPEEFKRLASEASVECLSSVIEIARDKRMRAADRIRAAELVCAYGVGKPVQTVDLQGADAPRVILLDM